jgi:hypothetical protein
MYKSVTPVEIAINDSDSEINLEDRNIIGFFIQNLGTANLTLYNQTVLQTEDYYEPPSNHLGIFYAGTIKISWGTGTKQAVLHALRGNL